MNLTRRSISATVLALSLGLGACADNMSKPEASLYQRLGGKDAITAVVDDFVGNVAGDNRINKFFARADISRLKRNLVDQICSASGGPCTYTGRDMGQTHDGMAVTAGEFDALVEDLVATLDEFEVPKAEQEELLGLLAPMRGDIVEQRRMGGGY